jgi:hypothetical protein
VRTLSRRTFLVTSAGTLLLAACSGGGDDASDPGGSAGGTDTDGAVPRNGTLAFRQDPSAIVATVPQRMVFSLRNEDGSATRGGPASIDFEVAEYEGEPIATVPGTFRSADGQEYYTFEVTLPAPGNYQAKVVGTAMTAAFTARAPEEVPIPRVGDQLVRVDTPTSADGRGVDPICTRVPPCPFHETNLPDALDGPRPIVLLIGTPAYCQTGVCGPVLEELITATSSYEAGTFDVIHAEIYEAPYTSATAPPTTATVKAFQLTFEPVLYVASADGIVRQRLDAIWDVQELTDALERALVPA